MQEGHSLGGHTRAKRTWNGLPFPNLIGIGPTRCATTWLYDVFKTDARFQFSQLLPKESFIFSHALPLSGVGSIFAHYPQPATGPPPRYRVDITPTYCLFSSAEIAWVKTLSPHAKIILFVRDPVGRAVSTIMRARKFAHLGGQGQTTPGSFGEYLSMNSGLTALGNQYQQIFDRWQSAFGDNVFNVFFDEVADDPSGVIRRLMPFLGIDNFAIPTDIEEGRNVSSDVPVTISRDALAATVKYWRRMPKPAFLPDPVFDQWRRRWELQVAEGGAVPRGRALKYRFLNVACRTHTALTGAARGLLGRLRAKRLRRQTLSWTLDGTRTKPGAVPSRRLS